MYIYSCMGIHKTKQHLIDHFLLHGHNTGLHGDEYTVHYETRRTRAVITRRRDKRKCKELPGRHPAVLEVRENVYQNKTDRERTVGTDESWFREVIVHEM